MHFGNRIDIWVPLGGVGAVSALADVFAEKVVALYELFSQGKLKEATKIQHEFCTLRDISKAGYSSIACLKSMLRLRGLDLGGVRAPAKSLSLAQEELKKRLNESG